MSNEAAERLREREVLDAFDEGFLLGKQKGEEFGRDQERKATVERIRAALDARKGREYFVWNDVYAILDAEAAP